MHRKVIALDIAESVRVAAPVWADLEAYCAELGVELVSVPPTADPADLGELVDRLAGVDVAVFACPDPYTRTARDLLAAAQGPDAVAPMDLLLHKARTRELCRRVGVPIPDGCEGAGREIAAAARALLDRTGRVLVKDPGGYAGMGVTRYTEPDALAAALDTDAEMVVEAFVDGEEFSVEAICGATGPRFVGWTVKGRTDDLHPLLRVRYTPPEPVPAVLTGPCERLLAASGYRGVAEVELVVADGRPRVLEANPRTSGVTPNGYFAGRPSALRHLVADLVGRELPSGPATGVADYQLPDTGDEPVPAGDHAYVRVPPPDTEFETRAYLTGTPDQIESTLARVSPDRAAQFAQRVEVAAKLLADEGLASLPPAAAR
ncbi:hypothetical protein ACIBBG_30520 [Micromonospora chersina]|uniref:hypothetical protein n=1 Tax=Micromonospora chersina TaxID=47854 RepID=UPI0037B4DFAE